MAAVEQKRVVLILTTTRTPRKKVKGWLRIKKIRKNNFEPLTAIKLKTFQRNSITTLRYNPMGEKGCLSCIEDITIGLMTVKTITKTGKYKNSV